ncbi:hypothetical protein GW17_00047232 [Ensete ventricosum]|nr:hypothetical protein GW17_00047232 [Ensete ventricosum]
MYILVRQVASTRTASYRAVPPKIDRRQSISTVDDRLKGEITRRQSIEGEINRRRSIEREKGKKKKRKKKKKKRKEKKKEYLWPARGPRLCAVAAHTPSSPAGCQRFFSRAGRKIKATSLKEEEEKKKKKKKKRSTSRHPSDDSARGSPASRRRPRVLFSPRGETERLPTRERI